MARKTRFDKTIEDLLTDNLPMDPLPHSNMEFFPGKPRGWQLEVEARANEQIERIRRKFRMSRREFVRTSAAFTICMWAYAQVTSSRFSRYAWAGNTGPNVSDDPLWDACATENPSVQLANLPGEVVFDVQTHHVMSDEKWRVTQPVHHAFICGLFGANHLQDGPENSNRDTCQNVGRWQHLKDIYLDSATTAGVLSPVPSAPDEQQPLPFDEADETAATMESLSGTMRIVTHGYIMPNRGWARSQGNGTPEIGIPVEDGRDGERKPAFLDDELDWMEERAIRYRRYLRGWKLYTPYGDVPFSSGMGHDDYAGRATNDKIMELNQKYGVPAVLASHKGVPLPTFDDRRQACDDVGPAARDYPDINFVIYHTGGARGENYYPGHDDATGNPTDLNSNSGEAAIDTKNFQNGTWGLIKTLREEGLDAVSNIPPGFTFGNSPNVSVDTGIGQSSRNGTFFGSMCMWLGPRRICHGTDAIWGGSPQAIIVKIRQMDLSPEGRAFFKLPHGFEGDRFEPSVDTTKGEDYTQAKKDALAAAIAGWVGATPRYTKEVQDIVANWPTDGQPHPERSLRNGFLGRNAADIYGFDADQMFKEISCDDVNRLREEYLTSQLASLRSTGPTRANQIWGPRTDEEVVRMRNREWKENGWIA